MVNAYQGLGLVSVTVAPAIVPSASLMTVKFEPGLVTSTPPPPSV